jgi:hypothetical protein
MANGFYRRSGPLPAEKVQGGNRRRIDDVSLHMIL